MTILEIAKDSGRSYDDVHRVLTDAGHHFTKKLNNVSLVWGFVPAEYYLYIGGGHS